jgi:3-carboxy-cis,cis-muconate cycloisomerase
MALFDDLFYSGPMLAVFSDEARLRRMLEFEAALASAEAACGLIPKGAAKAIVAECRFEILEVPAIQAGFAKTGTLAWPLVEQLTEAVRRKDAEAAKYIHWGATSQDVIDTGFMLQAREALDLIAGATDSLCAELATLSEDHAGTVMAGRTWLQQAVPVTFGWKAAGWLDAMLRHRARLSEVRERALALQFGGAAGTLASLAADGPRVSEKLASLLGLNHPDISWHASRDRVGEIATTLGVVTATLGKIAKDISLLMQTEVAEAFAPAGAGRGASSTMPQKRNPVACAAILAASVRVPGLVATVLSGAVQEHERGLGNWPAEWETVPEIFNLCAGALDRATELISGLEVDGERMRVNLDLTGGLIMAEAVTMAIAARIGKSAAHELVTNACQRAIREKSTLRETLLRDAEFSTQMTHEELDSALDPANYLGPTRKAIDKVLHRASAARLESNPTFLGLPGVCTHYRWDGPAGKPVLLFSNGLGTNLTMWDGQIAEFSQEFRVLRYDQRGHGRSSISLGPYSIEELGCDVVSLLDRLEVERCYFCGLSMGGMIGQWLGANAPERLAGLVLCNTAAKIGTVESWNNRIDLVLKGGMEAAIPVVLDRWFTAAFQASAPEVIARTRKMLVSTVPEGYVATCAALRDMDQREAARNISVKTLVVAGAHDAATSPAEAKYLADNIAEASYAELPAAHLSNVEAPAEFNAAVLQFLAAQERE